MLVMETQADVASVLAPLTTALTGSITAPQLVAILASIVGVGMTFVLMWFGARKLKQIFTTALTRGKISF